MKKITLFLLASAAIFSLVACGTSQNTFSNDTVRLTSPLVGQKVTSPLKVSGEARGTMFFEGQFPISLVDAGENALGSCQAKALEQWTTEDFVPFECDLEFEALAIWNGFLVIKNDNPSGLPENEIKFEIPVKF